MEELELMEEKTFQITFQALFKEFKKNLLLIIAIVVAFTAIGSVVGGFFIKTQYTSVASLMIKSDPPKELTEIIVNGTTLGEEESLARAFKAILESSDPIFVNAVTEYNSQNPSSTVNKEDVKENLTVKVSSVMINLEYTSSNPNSQQILDKIVKHMIKFVETKDEGGDYTYGPRYVDKLKENSPASEAKDDEDVRVFKYMAIFLVVGVVLSCAIIFLNVLFRDTYEDKESFEKDTGLEVFAVLGDMRKSVDKESV